MALRRIITLFWLRSLGPRVLLSSLLNNFVEVTKKDKGGTARLFSIGGVCQFTVFVQRGHVHQE